MTLQRAVPDLPERAYPTPVIVDDFYKDPDSIREWALAQQYRNVGTYSFPGWQATKAFTGDLIRRKIEEAIGRRITIDEEKYTFGGFRLISAKSGRHTKVHADSVSEWAAMVYLTPREPSSHGTGFFRHRETGLCGPPTMHQALALGYSSPDTFAREVTDPVASDLTQWDLVDVVEPTFNRFVAFQGGLRYHAPLGGGGDSPIDARLTHMFFFDERRVDPTTYTTWQL